MKIKWIKDYSGPYGNAPEGREDYILNVAGRELIEQGYAIEIKEEPEEIPVSTKDKPIKEPEVIELPEGHDKTLTEEEINKYTQTPKHRKPWWQRLWDKIK